MTADVVVVVVVHAEEVDRGGDRLEVAVVHERLEVVGRDIRDEVRRVAAEQQGLEERAVPQGVDAAGRVEVDRVGRIVRDRVREVQRDAELLGAARPQLPHGEAVGEVLVVECGEGRRRIGHARGVLAAGVGDERRAERLVEGRPVGDAIAEGVVDDRGVVARSARRCRGWPSRRAPGAPAAGPSGRA